MNMDIDMNRVGAGPKGPLGKSREAAICLVLYTITVY